MKMDTSYLTNFGRRRTAIVVLLAGIALLAGPLSARDQAGKKSKSIGFTLSADASEKDLGLPLYPGAKPYKEDAESDAALHMAMSGGSFGFKLVVLKLESSDSPEKIAAYYRKAMAKYGTVLDCSKATGNAGKTGSDKDNENPTHLPVRTIMRTTADTRIRSEQKRSSMWWPLSRRGRTQSSR